MTNGFPSDCANDDVPPRRSSRLAEKDTSEVENANRTLSDGDEQQSKERTSSSGSSVKGSGSSELKESDIRPREIPSPKDSVFLADMRSRQESSKALQEPGANFLEGVENDVRSTENSQNESHSQNHLWSLFVASFQNSS